MRMMRHGTSRTLHWSAIAPSAVTAVRVAIVPWLMATTLSGAPPWQPLGLLGIAIVTDVLDGVVARGTGAASPMGGRFDVGADFILLVGAFVALIREDSYPAWVLLVICGMFGQFVLTSGRGGPRYDPIGRSYGALLYGMVAITLALPDFAIVQMLPLTLLGVSAVSMLYRAAFLVSEARRCRDRSRYHSNSVESPPRTQWQVDDFVPPAN